jgi:hypothetical protein
MSEIDEICEMGDKIERMLRGGVQLKERDGCTRLGQNDGCMIDRDGDAD